MEDKKKRWLPENMVWILSIHSHLSLIRWMSMWLSKYNITPLSCQQTNWVAKTISNAGIQSFRSPCAETLIREFTSNAFSKRQGLSHIYLTLCKYCWSFAVD